MKAFIPWKKAPSICPGLVGLVSVGTLTLCTSGAVSGQASIPVTSDNFSNITSTGNFHLTENIYLNDSDFSPWTPFVAFVCRHCGGT